MISILINYSPVIVFVFVVACISLFIVRQQTCVIVERLGKFNRICYPGLNFKIPLVEAIRPPISLRIHQLEVDVETKTKDDVFVRVIIAVQYKVLPSKVYEAFYTLQDPDSQIKAFVFDLVRAQVPLLDLDDVFSRKDDVADAVRNELKVPMSDFGYEIIKALITDIDPDPNVKAAMNEINTAQRLRIASNEKGEAEKILKVKQAEAEAEASILHGQGVAGQRQAIIEGLSHSVEDLVRQTGLTPTSVMDMVLLIQYIDALKDIGANSRASVVFVPHSPGSIASVNEQLRETIFAASAFELREEKN
ncbi:MAG: SPFH domain-containing protein [Holosporales bacterium]|jgi:regulator of protease activity HflC (stomatin/prohibitin superfamily)|nr:SPFH domain-containing protein [Holosporales bacterium]